MNIYNKRKKEVRRSNYNLISLSLVIIIIITIISIVVVLFAATPIGRVVFAQNSSSISPNSILDKYTYVCIKFNETVEERDTPENINTNFLNTQGYSKDDK